MVMCTMGGKQTRSASGWGRLASGGRLLMGTGLLWGEYSGIKIVVMAAQLCEYTKKKSQNHTLKYICELYLNIKSDILHRRYWSQRPTLICYTKGPKGVHLCPHREAGSI